MIKKLYNFFIIIIFGMLLTTFFNKLEENNDYSQNSDLKQTSLEKVFS